MKPQDGRIRPVEPTTQPSHRPRSLAPPRARPVGIGESVAKPLDPKPYTTDMNALCPVCIEIHERPIDPSEIVLPDATSPELFGELPSREPVPMPDRPTFYLRGIAEPIDEDEAWGNR